MIYQNEYVEERTILEPVDTQIRIEAWLGDCRYIDKWDKTEAYSFSFYPQTMLDHQNLLEVIENAVTTVQLRKDRHSRKEGRKLCENKDGSLFCSQLFLPKINVQYENTEQLNGMACTLALHLRDLPMGEVVIQADYIDLYDQPEFPVIDTVNEEDIIERDDKGHSYGCIDW